MQPKVRLALHIETSSRSVCIADYDEVWRQHCTYHSLRGYMLSAPGVLAILVGDASVGDRVGDMNLGLSAMLERWA